MYITAQSRVSMLNASPDSFRPLMQEIVANARGKGAGDFQTITASGTLDPNGVEVFFFDSTAGALAITLPDAAQNMILRFCCTVFGGNVVITPTNFNTYTTLTLSAAGQGGVLVFDADSGQWSATEVATGALA